MRMVGLGVTSCRRPDRKRVEQGNGVGRVWGRMRGMNKTGAVSRANGELFYQVRALDDMAKLLVMSCRRPLTLGENLPPARFRMLAMLFGMNKPGAVSRSSGELFKPVRAFTPMAALGVTSCRR